MRIRDCNTSPEDKERGIVRLNVELSPVEFAKIHHGKTARELRDLGFKVVGDVPDFAVLRLNGYFEWFSLNVDIKTKD